MDCMVRAFEEFIRAEKGSLARKVNPIPCAGTYHIQEIVGELAQDWHITEFYCSDIDGTNPKTQEYVLDMMKKYKGVATYWTANGMQHAVAWFGGTIPNLPFSIFWRVEPRIDSALTQGKKERA